MVRTCKNDDDLKQLEQEIEKYKQVQRDAALCCSMLASALLKTDEAEQHKQRADQIK